MLSLGNLPTTDVMREVDLNSHMHPFTDHDAIGAEDLRVITSANGVFIGDSDGNQILDGMAGLWCVNVGYGRTEIADAAARQMAQLPYYNTFFKTTHPPVIALSEKLRMLTPAGINKFMFGTSGSDSNDTVIRLARTYWAGRGKPEKSIMIARHNAYHGSSMASASLGGMAFMHAQGGLPIPDVHHIGQPYWFDEGGDMDPDAFGLMRARELEAAIDALGEDRVAAFIAEPIQGAGGVIIPPDSYWPEIQRICDERDILLVADEVICGFGRLGTWFGSHHFDLRPDMMAMAKGLSSGYLPIGGVGLTDEVYEGVSQMGEFAHGYTYSGHPVSAAAALANLDILEREGIVDRVGAHTAGVFAEKFKALGDHPLVGEAATCGLLGRLELVPDAKSGSRRRFDHIGTVGGICRDNCFANNLVMRAVKDSMVCSPPLIISDDEIDSLVERAWKALDLTASAVADQMA